MIIQKKGAGKSRTAYASASTSSAFSIRTIMRGQATLDNRLERDLAGAYSIRPTCLECKRLDRVNDCWRRPRTKPDLVLGRFKELRNGGKAMPTFPKRPDS